ncbi:helix-turn-helix domain-containing protein [Streptococcus alactolyticus]|uniref:helix-turn-helix domain-containing protein n=1 Tax=Streptococcus alactolyticus TaxID=29389 RepID=UPI003F9B652F
MNMTLGQKLRKIRIFRNMTQKEVGEKSDIQGTADIRMLQYEHDKRKPLMNRLKKIATALSCNIKAISYEMDESPEDLMELLFWMEEERPGCIQFMTVATPNEDQQVALYFNDALINDYLHEWDLKKIQLACDLITEDEYFDWKINWPEKI